MRRRSRRARVALAFALAAPGAHALEVHAGLGLEAFELRERAAPSGTTLLREHATALPALRLELARPLGERWSLHGALSLLAGRAAYDGRTQAGAPFPTRTDERLLTLEGSIGWRLPGFDALAGEAGLQAESFRRRIHGDNGIAGLDERLGFAPRARLGLRGEVGGVAWRLGGVVGGRAPLDVRFDDGVFDAARLDSGRARGIDAALGHALGDRWRLEARFERLTVERSTDAALTQSGAGVGSVMQPSWRRERLGLYALRAF